MMDFSTTFFLNIIIREQSEMANNPIINSTKEIIRFESKKKKTGNLNRAE